MLGRVQGDGRERGLESMMDLRIENERAQTMPCA